MGIFSSEYEYYAFSQTQPLIGDDSKQDTLLTFVASALKHNEENLVGNIIAATRAGLPGTAYQYFNYGRNSYYWGLPESTYTSFELDTDSILDVIGHNKFVKETYLPIDGPFMAAIQYLNQQSWFSINLKEITLPLQIGGEYPTADPFSFSVTVSPNYKNLITISFDITWPTPSVSKPDVYNIGVYDPYNVNKTASAVWIIYGYKSQQNDPEPPGWDANRVWPPSYQRSEYYPSSAFPAKPINLEPVDFYPIAVFQKDQVGYKSNGRWKTTLRELVRKLNLDADEIYDEFQNSLKNSQANKAELVDFLIGFFVRIYADISPGSWKNPKDKYVFEFIAGLHLGSVYNRTNYEQYLEDLDEWDNWVDPNFSDGDIPEGYIPRKPRRPTPPQQSMGVSEADGKGFSYVFSYSLIEKYTSYISHADAESKFTPFSLDDKNGHYGMWIRGIDYQDSGTQRYVSYMLVNAESTYSVNTPDGGRSARPENGVWCPVSYDLLKRLTYRDQEAILQNGLCAVVTTVLEQEINWYQGNFWGGLTLLITFATVVWIGFVGIKGVLSAIGLSAVGGAALTIATLIIKLSVGMLIQLSGAYLGLGETGQMVLSIVAGIAMSGAGAKLLAGIDSLFSDLWLNLDKFLTFDGLSALQSKVGQLFKAGRMVYSLVNTGEDDDGTEDYTQSKQDKREELEQAYLGTPSRKITDPHLELSRRLDTNMFETPSQYMARTTETNPGAKALAMPANYVDMALQLPRTLSTGVTVGVYV